MKRVRFAGFGGQGIAMAGYVLGKAVAIHEGREAVFTQEYGPESRGGASSASVVVDDLPITEPFFDTPDVLVAMSQAALDRYGPTVAHGARVLVDGDLVEGGDPPDSVRLYAIDATRMAEDLGVRVAANVVMLGFLAALEPDLVDVAALREAVASSVPDRFVDVNLKALAAGLEAGRSAPTGDDR